MASEEIKPEETETKIYILGLMKKDKGVVEKLEACRGIQQYSGLIKVLNGG